MQLSVQDLRIFGNPSSDIISLMYYDSTLTLLI